MVQASNLSSEKKSKEEKQTTRMGPLTFDVNPELEEDKHIYLAAVDNQTKLMRWHYCLGHLAFSKLKQLALNGKIPQRLAKVKSCLYGLPLWCYDQGPLERMRDLLQSVCGNKGRSMC
jgi:hypothetical protein